MLRLGFPHLIFSAVAAAFFTVFGILALPFPQTAQWFPLYVSVFGVGLSLAGAVLSLIAIRRTRGTMAAVTGTAARVIADDAVEVEQHESDGPLLPPDEEQDDRGTTLRGFLWLAVWLGFVVLGLLIGYVAASALWVGVWFRTVHKWRWRIVAPVVAVVVALLLLAQIQLNIAMPGFDWLRMIFRW